MAFFESIIAVAVFLSVIATVVFVMLIIGIRRGDRARHLSYAPDTTLDAFARSFLGVGVRHNHQDES